MLARPLPLPAAEPLPAPSGKSLLRFITCGSVDDGKSTLIGRLLHEVGAVFEDQAEALAKDSRKFGTDGANIDFALLVDGLAAEREQGITIDVAYRYFASENRAFIVADTPGHEQYTRNMATGASGTDAAIVLVDARKGILPQTRRHSFIISLVGVKHVILAVNKMDLVGFEATRFSAIVDEYRALAKGLEFESIIAIPVCARAGDNLVARSARMPWYQGAPLLEQLETLAVDTSRQNHGFALPVQWVNRPDGDFRGFSGTIAAGSVKPGDHVMALPSRRETRVARIVTFDGDRGEAAEGDAITLTLEDDIDLSRGDVLVSPQARFSARQVLNARVLITGARPLRAGDDVILKLGTGTANARLTHIHHVVDIETYNQTPAPALAPNAIGLVSLRLDRPIVASPFQWNTVLGSLLLIDRATHETLAFGCVSEEAIAAGKPNETKGLTLKQQATAVFRFALGPDWRRLILPAVSWRLFSATLVGFLLYGFTGRIDLALLAASADIVLRSLLRHAHGHLWARLFAWRDPVNAGRLSLDGDGI